MTDRINVAIIDLDNCIANDQWRLPLIDLSHPQPNDRYSQYHSKCHLDRCENKHVLEQLRQQGYELIVFTSRPDSVRIKTSQWLKRHGISYGALHMRPNYCHLPSVEMKRIMLSWLPAHYQVMHAIDDRHDILDMYRAEGIPSTQRVFIYEPEIVHP